MSVSNYNLDVSVLSQGLTTAQKYAIKNSLLKLALQEKLSDIRFWGKITGTTADYFIGVSTSIGSSISKRFYWSNDEGATFALLPQLDDFITAKSPKIAKLFTGNPARKYKDPDAPPRVNEDGEIEEEEENSDNEEEEEEEEVEDEVDEDGNPIEKKPPPRRLAELERLSYSVSQIDASTCIVPRGHYYLTATGDILTNPGFTGLNIEQSRQLSNYLLLRNAERASTLAHIRKQGVSNHHDFLDPIIAPTDSIKHIWSMHVSDSGLDVSIRSLMFPGYEFQIEAGSKNYCGAYFGNGIKNEDIVFML